LIRKFPTVLWNMGKRKVIKGLRAVFNGEEILEDVEVLVESGRILDIGKNLKGVEIVYEGKVLYPTFADPHTHLIYAGDRLEEFKMKIDGLDYLEILKKGGGIYSTVNKTVSASDEELLEQTLKRLKILNGLGVGVVEIKTGYGLDFEQEIRLLRLINFLKGKLRNIKIFQPYFST
jgi:Imidazolonepropionase and related amidohydrolases